MKIPVNTGRLCTGAYLKYSPLDGNYAKESIDHPTTLLPNGPGGLSTKPQMTAWRSPIAHHYDVATIKKVEASVYLNNMFKFSINDKPKVQPQVRSILPMRRVNPVVHMSNGGSPNMPSDSAFHPINRPAPIPKFKSERKGEANDVPSFTSRNNLWYGSNQSFYQDQTQIGSGRVGQPRWSTVKLGAVK
jgi:hypothetical protein